MNTQNDIEAVVELIRSLMLSLCCCSDEFSLDAEDDGTTVLFRARANPSDVARIVGARRAHLKAIETIAMMALWNHRRHAEFAHVDSTRSAPANYDRFHKETFDSELARSLLDAVIRSVFPEAVFQIDTDQACDPVKITAWITGGDVADNEVVVTRLSHAVHELWIAIGSNNGGRINANVTTSDRRVVVGEHATRQAARPAHVSGPKPDERWAGISGQHRGVSRERNLPVPGLRSTAASAARKGGKTR